MPDFLLPRGERGGAVVSSERYLYLSIPDLCRWAKMSKQERLDDIRDYLRERFGEVDEDVVEEINRDALRVKREGRCE